MQIGCHRGLSCLNGLCSIKLYFGTVHWGTMTFDIFKKWTFLPLDCLLSGPEKELSWKFVLLKHYENMFVLLQIYSGDSRQLFLSLMIIILECNIVSARLIRRFHTWCRCWWCRCSCKEYTYKRSNIKRYYCSASQNFKTTIVRAFCD